MSVDGNDELATRLAELEKENAELKVQLSRVSSESRLDFEQSDEAALWQDVFVCNYETFIFDCDGVIWREGKAIDGVKETLKHLEQSKKRIIFLSNTSTKAAETYQSKLNKLFNINITKNHVFTSALATASYLNKIASKNNEMNETESKESESIEFDIKKDKILLIGSNNLYSIIKDFGFDVLWTGNDNDFPGFKSMKPNDICDIELDATVKVKRSLIFSFLVWLENPFYNSYTVNFVVLVSVLMHALCV